MVYSKTCAECKNPFADGELVSLVRDGRVYHNTRASFHGEPQEMPIGCKDARIMNGESILSDHGVFYGGHVYDAYVLRLLEKSGEVRVEFNPTKTATQLVGNLEIIAAHPELRL